MPDKTAPVLIGFRYLDHGSIRQFNVAPGCEVGIVEQSGHAAVRLSTPIYLDTYSARMLAEAIEYLADRVDEINREYTDGDEKRG